MISYKFLFGSILAVILAIIFSQWVSGATLSRLHLHGPVPSGIPYQEYAGAPGQWQWPGSALSASTARLYPYLVSPGFILQAEFTIIYIPNGVAIRVVKFDPGPANIEVIAELPPNYRTTPIAATIDLTDEINFIYASDFSDKRIGYQIKGPNQFHLFDVHLDIVWQ